MTTATRLRRWRRHQGKTLQEIAGRLGIQVSTLSRIERGDRPVKAEMVERIAAILGISMAELYGDLPPEKRAAANG